MQVRKASAASSADSDLDLLRDAAGEAGRIAMRYFKQNPEVWMKGGTSPVSEADYAADRYLFKTLLDARPGYGWLSEETVENRRTATGERSFIVDPIDGTRGFLEGNPQWCVSVAIVEQGRTIAGVLECPASGERFEAQRGGGGRLNGVPIRVRAQGDTNLSLGGPKLMGGLLPAAWRARIRPYSYVPSLAYRIALIASGRLDATFIKPNAHDWDIAAAMLILEEAGGLVLNEYGRQPELGLDDPRHAALAAGSGPLLEVMVEALSEYSGSAD